MRLPFGIVIGRLGIGSAKDVCLQTLGQIQSSDTARMRTLVDRHGNGSPLRYATARTWKCEGSRLDCEWLFAVEGYSLDRHSVAWGQRRFVGGKRISSNKKASVEVGKIRQTCRPPSSASAPAHFGGQHSPEPRLASPSLGEGWWRWRESNPRPKAFSEQRLHAYPTQYVSQDHRWNRPDRHPASSVDFRQASRSMKPA